MLLSIKEMEVRKLRFAETYQPGEIDFADSGVTQSAPLVVQGMAELLPHTGGEVRVKGKVETEMEAECDRCLGRAQFHIDSSFDLFYRLADAGEAEEEEAIDEGEAEMGFYELPGLELEEILREQVLLQLPMQRICAEACKGICPVCGANRNESECGCRPHLADDRWNALKDLYI
jgi:uncharacterized protein